MSKTTLPQCSTCTIADRTIWEGLSDSRPGEMADLCLPSRYRKGDVIYHEGSACTGLYTVCQGTVKLVRAGRGGRQTIVRIQGSGDTLAEDDLFRSDGRNGATAQAMEDAVVCFVSRATLMETIDETPKLAMNLVHRMAESMHKLERRVERLATQDARHRLIGFLLELAASDGEAHEGGIRIRLRLTREEIAEVIGATLETTIRLVSGLKRDGLLADLHGHIMIKDQAALERRGGLHLGVPRSAAPVG